MREPIDPGHENVRGVLKTVGPVLLVAGGLCMAVAFIDLVLTMMDDGFRQPKFFWCFFLGMPLLVAGGAMTNAAYAGRIARYFSQEATPVATDTFNYAAKEVRASVRELAGAIGEGLSAQAAPAVETVCRQCRYANQPDARFCSKCGAALDSQIACPACGDLNNRDARFCDHCGKPIER
jgi:RNA polymerase subunit RPABC4/transcription elongation factor Spt4